MDHQKLVSDFVEKHGLSNSLEILFIDLASELGELGKELILSSNYGKVAIKINEKIKSEIGDIYYSLISLCNHLNIELREELDKTVVKYQKRIIGGDNPGSEND